MALFEEIKDFLISERWDYSFELKHNTSLQDDLKIYGDDAYDILLKFCKKFNVDPYSINLSDYFKGEPSWMDIFEPKKNYKKMDIEDLVAAAENGKFNS